MTRLAQYRETRRLLPNSVPANIGRATVSMWHLFQERNTSPAPFRYKRITMRGGSISPLKTACREPSITWCLEFLLSWPFSWLEDEAARSEPRTL